MAKKRGKKRAAAPKKEEGYKMAPLFPEGELIHDTYTGKTWKLGQSVGVGGFGMIYCACDSDVPEDYSFVVKIPPHSSPKDSRAKLTRQYAEDIPDISHYDIRMAMLKKAPNDNGITTELLRAGGTSVLKVLQKLFNSARNRGVVGVGGVFLQECNNTFLTNYRTMSLLSHVLIPKLVSRVITNCLSRRFDDSQPSGQAGFRKGYNTLLNVIKKTED